MGFNNRGAPGPGRSTGGCRGSRGNLAVGIPIGISIGKTKNVPLADAIEDYLASLRILAPYADYLAVNISSPNTPGLRSLHDAQPLADLIQALVTEAWRLAAGDPPVPIFVKVAPDLTESALEDVVGVCNDAGAEGLIATNTTVSRDGLLAEAVGRRARRAVGSSAHQTSPPRSYVSSLDARRCRSSGWAAS